MTDQAPEFEGSQSIGDFPIKIKGNTDNTLIGNIGDYLKTTALVTFPTGKVIAWNKYLKNYDMNASNGGVARNTSVGTTFTTIFSYNASAGYFIGFRLSLEDKINWFVRLILDSEDIFINNGGINLNDVSSKNIYGWEWGDTADDAALGFNAKDETFTYQAPIGYPIRFDSSIIIQVKHRTTTKKFRAGLVSLQRDL